MSRNLVNRLLVLTGLALLVTAGAVLEHPTIILARTPQQSTPSVTLSPATALPNQSIAITGASFTSGGNPTLASISVGGTPVPEDKINFGKAVNIGNGGTFVTNLIIPVNSATLGAGEVTIAVTDCAGATASVLLTISIPALAVSPASSRVGSQVTVTGSNFPVDSTTIGADDVPQVTLEYETASNQFQPVATILPDSTGGFASSFTVPSGASLLSNGNRIRAAMGNSSAEITTTHSILAPTITLSPAQGPPHTTVNLEGVNFAAFAPVESLRLGNLGVEIPVSLYTDGSGSFSTTFEVPEMDGGNQSLVLMVGGTQFTQLFTVQSSPESTEADDYSPPPQKFELVRALRPLGDNLVRVFYFDNRTKQWSFYDPDPRLAYFNTLTELVEGRAYWIAVAEDQSPLIQGSFRTFIAGWNLVVW